MNPHKAIADHQRTVEAVEAADGPHVRTWSVYAGVAGSKYLGEVEAPTGAAAIEAAYDLEEASISLCYQCADEVEDPEVSHVTVVCEETDEEATDRPDPDLRLHEIVRARQALRLWGLAERAAAGFPVAGRGEPQPAFVGIWPPLEPGQGWRVSLSHGGTFDGTSLAEAVETALAELGHG